MDFVYRESPTRCFLLKITKLDQALSIVGSYFCQSKKSVQLHCKKKVSDILCWGRENR